ncbi:universal stress protein [Adhaeribacter soli]|uniref:Universal stress protein n=1 Tax=Adhaeribacter soli TaxID=2607655 RepID=A0A5N1J4A3_9BACT|nr:universal stress protein [Adhaeribacter soli]KAA9345736.1 universal stress protein [Adhaeribacter soli]
MKKLLILTDLSDQSINTYRYGLQLAQASGTQIMLLFCTGETSLTTTGQLTYLQRLRSYADRFANPSGRHMKCEYQIGCTVTAGEPVKAIGNLVENWQPDLLLADDGYLKNLTSQTPVPLQTLFPCPAILVPADAVYKKIKQVVFATDFGDQDPEVAEGICKVARSLGAQVTFLHFYPKADRTKLATLTQQAEALKAQLTDVKVRFRLIEEDDLLEGLNEYAENNRADLFVLATQDTHLLQQYFQVTYRKTQAFNTRVPLLNLYQERQSPCSAGCSFCHSHEEHEQKTAVAV